MFEFYAILTGAVTLAGGFHAWRITRDPFHPGVLIAPLFFYFYCVWPWIINRHGELAVLFTVEQLEHTTIIYLLSISALYAGLLKFAECRLSGPGEQQPRPDSLSLQQYQIRPRISRLKGRVIQHSIGLYSRFKSTSRAVARPLQFRFCFRTPDPGFLE